MQDTKGQIFYVSTFTRYLEEANSWRLRGYEGLEDWEWGTV
jgi:hypothetical protein